MNARPTTTLEYRREVDPLFGRVERFKAVKAHRVQVKIGNGFFVSAKTYADAECARKAAARLNAKASS